MSTPNYKKCGKCEELKPTHSFYRSSTRRDGLQSWCKECFSLHRRERRSGEPEVARARESAWRERFRESSSYPDFLEKRREYYRNNREQIAKQRADKYWENPDAYRMRRVEWYRNNPEKALESAARYRANNPEKLEEYRRYAREYRREQIAEGNRERNDMTANFATKSRSKWTCEEDDFLINLDGISIYEAAIHLGRTYNACVCRRRILRKEMNNV